MMTIMKQTAGSLRTGGTLMLAAALLLATAGEAVADYRSSGSAYHHPNPAPAPVRVAQSSERRYHYRVGYRDGDSGFNWLGFQRGRNSNNGYTGPGGNINRPHRSDWNAKIAAQRRWDEAQYKKMQENGGLECGLSNAPAYCYRLNKPYPQVIEVVRY